MGEAGYDVTTLAPRDPRRARWTPCRSSISRRARGPAESLTGPLTVLPPPAGDQWPCTGVARPVAMGGAAEAVAALRVLYDSNEEYDSDDADQGVDAGPRGGRSASVPLVRSPGWPSGSTPRRLRFPPRRRSFCAAGVRSVLVRNFPPRRSREGVPVGPSSTTTSLLGGSLPTIRSRCCGHRRRAWSVCVRASAGW